MSSNRLRKEALLTIAAACAVVGLSEGSALAQQTVVSLFGPAVVPFQNCVEIRGGRGAIQGSAVRVVFEFPVEGGNVQVVDVDAPSGSPVANCMGYTLGRVRGPRHNTPGMRAECLVPLPGTPTTALQCGPPGSLTAPAASAPAAPRTGAPPSSSEGSSAQENSARACRDGEDNDGDGHVDCADQDCGALLFCSQQQQTELEPEESADACQDGRDNDGDGHTDCVDQDCGDFLFCAQTGASTGGGWAGNAQPAPQPQPATPQPQPATYAQPTATQPQFEPPPAPQGRGLLLVGGLLEGFSVALIIPGAAIMPLGGEAFVVGTTFVVLGSMCLVSGIIALAVGGARVRRSRMGTVLRRHLAFAPSMTRATYGEAPFRL